MENEKAPASNNSSGENKFDASYSSKIEPIYIALPDFSFFHGASSEENVDNKFVERKKITDQLTSWLTDSVTKTGVYLVTGFRGMGKSSFVGKVLSDISAKPSKRKETLLNIKIAWIIAASFISVWLCLYFYSQFFTTESISLLCLTIEIIVLLLIFLLFTCLYRIRFLEKKTVHGTNKKDKRKIKADDRCSIIVQVWSKFKNLFITDENGRWFIIKQIRNKFKNHFTTDEKCSKISIKLNLGHEVLNEQDILSLIAKSIEYEYIKYSKSLYIHITRTYIKAFYLFIMTLLLSLFCIVVIYPAIQNTYHQKELRDVKQVKTNNSLSINENNYNSNYGETGTDNSHEYKINNSVLIKETKESNGNWFLNINIVLKEINSSIKTVAPIPQTHLLTLIFTFLGSLVFSYSIWELILKIINRISKTNNKILKDLKLLNTRIASSVSEDSGPGGGFSTSILGLSFNRKRQHYYPLANVREIEFELSDILDRISNTKNPPNFIIVFDELDKIDPVKNHEYDNEIDIIPEFEQTGSGFPGGATSRKRKQNLLKMLANMKYFISTAKAKFIFIAGRELYDAFLADVSDREFAVGSVFTNVIYVDSFLSSEHHKSEHHKDITSRTEQFICKQLLPKYYINEEKENYYTFYFYNKYLKDEIFLNGGIDADLKRQKVMVFLQHFSLYLAHVSNGAPKKIAIYFEKYIESFSMEDNQKLSDRGLVVASEKQKTSEGKHHYLAFGYKNQRKIGFIHYMAFPLANAIFNSVSQYNDKLLVSACFLTNQIYKYHNNGFSWRNLENIPELLEVNKTPELREFIDVIISFLRKSHISTVASGLYNFKFPMQISEEISLMSKFSEEVSALFNFTLDDSLSVKRHYAKLLKYYTSIADKKNDLHHVIMGIHHILGDLHLFDEEYNNAIFEYQSGIQILHNTKPNENTSHYASHVLNLLRMMLKLGLTHEKRKTYNAAYNVYNEIISILIKFRYVDESKLGLNYAHNPETELNWKEGEDILYHYNYLPSASDFEKNTLPKVFNKNTNYDYIVKGNEMIPFFSKQLTPAKNAIIVNLSMFEDIRLIYQPLLAKLFVLEKEGLSGITKENLDIMESEFLFLHRSIHFTEKFMISADFFRKVGDILYYKNGLLNVHENKNSFFTNLYYWGYDIEKDIYNYCASINSFKDFNSLRKKIFTLTFNDFKNPKNDMIISFLQFEPFKNKFKKYAEKMNIYNNQGNLKMNNCNQRRQYLLEQNKKIPCHACRYYSRSLNILMENLCKDNEDKFCSRALFFLDRIKEEQRDKFKSLKESDLSILASTLDGLGNTLLSCSYGSDIISARFLDWFLTLVEKSDYEIKKGQPSNFSYLEKAILYFWTAASNFKYASNMKGAFLCYKKIIQVFVSYCAYNNTQSNAATKKIKEIEERCIQKYWENFNYWEDLEYLEDLKYLEYHEYWKIKKEQEYFKENILIIKDKIAQIGKVIFDRAIQNIFVHYENTNITEFEKLKQLLNKDDDNSINIPLHLLSLFPDLEELILGYYELELLCGKADNIYKIYNSSFLSKYRIESTVCERIASLRFKAIVNMEILRQLIPYNYLDDNKIDEYSFYTVYKNYLISEETIKNLLGSFSGCLQRSTADTNTIEERISLLEFLIIDSIFSLLNIIETITPSTKTTLFTESYIAEIYSMLAECNQVYQLFCGMHKDMGKLEIPDSFKGKVTNFSKFLSDKLEKKIGKSDTYSNSHAYFVEMALQRYKKAREMHREGLAYKEMIANMHFLDDDLNNDTCQFYYAIERYLNNCGIIDEKINILKKIGKEENKLFKIESFLN